MTIWNWCKQYKAIVAIFILFLAMLAWLIVDAINYRKELNAYDALMADTTEVVVDDSLMTDTLVTDSIVCGIVDSITVE